MHFNVNSIISIIFAVLKFCSSIDDLKECPLPYQQHGLYLSTLDSTKVELVCDEGFEPFVSAVATCNITVGEYEPLPLCIDTDECKTKACHNHAVCTNTVGSYQCVCMRGYFGDGFKCFRNLRCTYPGVVPHGNVHWPNKGNRVSYTCDELQGYVLYGPQRRTCRKGRWDKIQPSCIKPYDPNSCNKPEQLENGIVLGKNYHINQNITYRCNANYTLLGSIARMCTEQQTWSGSQPRCEKMITTLEEVGKTLRDEFVNPLKAMTKTGKRSEKEERLRPTALGLDLVFLVDRSSSIQERDMKTGIEFAKQIIGEFGISNSIESDDTGTRYALITIGTTAALDFNLKDPAIRSVADVNKRFDGIKPEGGGTAINQAFEMVWLDVGPQLRKGAKRAIFIITDGEATDQAKDYLAKLLKDKLDFEIFGIGIGQTVDKSMLRRFASEPHIHHIFILSKFDDLKSLTNFISEKTTDYNLCGVSGNIEKKNHNANKGAWPWAVILIADAGGSPQMCGGTLICDNFVLTSGACLYSFASKKPVLLPPKNVTVYLGEHSLLKFEGSEQRLAAEKLYVLDSYRPGNRTDDIGLIQMGPDTAVLKKKVRVACLVPNPGTLEYTKITWSAGIDGWIYGWKTGPKHNFIDQEVAPSLVIRQRKQPTVLRSDCVKAFPEISKNVDLFCTGFRLESDDDDDVCRGDVGGAFVKRGKDDKFDVIGVASDTKYCSHPRKYGLYTSVVGQRISDWIGNVTSNCNHKKHQLSILRGR